jgi:hypothetical protein
MKTRFQSSAGFLLAIVLVIGMSAPVAAALALPKTGLASSGMPLAQFTPFPTPTPLPDGRIIHIAIEGDSAWRIAAIYGLDLEELRSLNKWGDNPNIQTGGEIILGFASVVEPTQSVGPAPTPAPVLPTPSAQPGWGELCIILYNDVNGDSMRQESELSLPGGAISISSQTGTFSLTADTISSDSHQCFKEVPEGRVFISVAVPNGYSPTTNMDYDLTIGPGEKAYLPFGAQANSETEIQMPTPQGSGKSPILAFIGGGFLIVAVGLALFAARLIRFK